MPHQQISFHFDWTSCIETTGQTLATDRGCPQRLNRHKYGGVPITGNGWGTPEVDDALLGNPLSLSLSFFSFFLFLSVLYTCYDNYTCIVASFIQSIQCLHCLFSIRFWQVAVPWIPIESQLYKEAFPRLLKVEEAWNLSDFSKAAQTKGQIN